MRNLHFVERDRIRAGALERKFDPEHIDTLGKDEQKLLDLRKYLATEILDFTSPEPDFELKIRSNFKDQKERDIAHTIKRAISFFYEAIDSASESNQDYIVQMAPESLVAKLIKARPKLEELKQHSDDQTIDSEQLTKRALAIMPTLLDDFENVIAAKEISEEHTGHHAYLYRVLSNSKTLEQTDYYSEMRYYNARQQLLEKNAGTALQNLRNFYTAHEFAEPLPDAKHTKLIQDARIEALVHQDLAVILTGIKEHVKLPANANTKLMDDLEAQLENKPSVSRCFRS